MKFKFLEHTADVKFQAFGKDEKEMFENSALALKEAIAGKIRIKEKIKKKFIIKGHKTDYEKMLYNFLEEFLYLLDAEDFLLSKVKVKLFQTTRLEAEVFGDKASNYNFTNNVKAITYNEMFVKKGKGKWISQVVVDA
jgi:SHS2 domain-containing protein